MYIVKRSRNKNSRISCSKKNRINSRYIKAESDSAYYTSDNYLDKYEHHTNPGEQSPDQEYINSLVAMYMSKNYETKLLNYFDSAVNKELPSKFKNLDTSFDSERLYDATYLYEITLYPNRTGDIPFITEHDLTYLLFGLEGHYNIWTTDIGPFIDADINNNLEDGTSCVMFSVDFTGIDLNALGIDVAKYAKEMGLPV